MMLLLDHAVELQQLHQLSKDLGRAMPREDALNGPLPEVIAKIMSLIHEQEHHGQDPIMTEVRQEIPVQGSW